MLWFVGNAVFKYLVWMWFPMILCTLNSLFTIYIVYTSHFNELPTHICLSFAFCYVFLFFPLIIWPFCYVFLDFKLSLPHRYRPEIPKPVPYLSQHGAPVEGIPRNLKGKIGSLFDPCVNAMGWRPYWPSHMEASYCTFGFGGKTFGAICAQYRYRVIHRAITIVRV